MERRVHMQDHAQFRKEFQKRRHFRDNWANGLLIMAVVAGILISGTQSMSVLTTGTVLVVISATVGIVLLK